MVLRNIPCLAWAMTALLAGVGAATAGAAKAPRAGGAPSYLNLTHAVVELDPSAGPVERKAAQLLTEEAAKRSGVTLQVVTHRPAGTAVIRLSDAPAAGSTLKPESYSIQAARKGGVPVVTVRCADASACVFAAGYLLREMRLTPGKIEAAEMNVVRTPDKSVRGHQIGWRKKSNTYMSWTPERFEQYVRDLAIWGTNAIELIPYDPDTDPVKSEEKAVQFADIIHSYGMHVWLWFAFDDRAPAMYTADGKDGSTACPHIPAGRAFLLDRRRRLFTRMKYLDAVFIPGGDPGGCECPLCTPWEPTFVPLCAEMAAILHESHPTAKLWLSNQMFSKEDNRNFHDFMTKERPSWLAGLVYAPWTGEQITSARAFLPDGYKMRMYPDITHETSAQFTVPDLDQAFAWTIGREAPLYRLHQTQHLVQHFRPYIDGSISYSDGVNDDIHKALWSALLWDPNEDLRTLVTDYGRYFFGENVGARVADGLFSIEKNTIGPLKDNPNPELTFNLWSEIEKQAEPFTQKSWRYQLALLRSKYDLYVQRRLRADLQLEGEVYAALQPHTADSVTAALNLLKQSKARVIEPELRETLIGLGQSLFDAVNIKLSAKRWGGTAGRATLIDSMDVPLANQEWLGIELNKLAALTDAVAISAGIDRILKWEDPGPGGFYDDLGVPGREPHLIYPKAWGDDPDGLQGPRTEFRTNKGWRQSWNNFAETLFGTPLSVRYTNLDPAAQYSLRVVYAGRFKALMDLTANDRYPIHGPMKPTEPPTQMEWPIPREATTGGTLTLTWTLSNVKKPARGCDVAEIWLIKHAAAAAP